MRSVIRLLLRFGLNRRRAIGLVQNPDDRDMLAELGVKPDHIVSFPAPASTPTACARSPSRTGR